MSKGEDRVIGFYRFSWKDRKFIEKLTGYKTYSNGIKISTKVIFIKITIRATVITLIEFCTKYLVVKLFHGTNVYL